MGSDLLVDVEAFLATMADDAAATLKSSPRSTIIPRGDAGDSGRRAVELLEQLGASPRSSARLELGETLGQGGMGVVHVGTQVALGRQVAVKTLRADKKSDAAILDLLREAWVTGTLEHPNVVPVYDIGVDADGDPLIVLKKIAGVHWGDYIDDAEAVRERFGAEDLLEWNLGIFQQVANAVRFAHDRGIIHRDIKPENVMIGEFGEVYVVDWGIAVSLRPDPTGRLPSLATASDMAGTPCYMAPEMLGRDDDELSELSDIYLLGAVLYEIIAGQPPHDAGDAAQVIAKILASDPPMPDGAPPGLVRICRRAMDADPRGRFENATQLRLAVQGFLQHRGSERLSAEADRRLAELDAALAGADGDERGRRRRVYELFAECRFGYRAALGSWSRNPAALDGLARATMTMIEHELASGNPRAAESLLPELGVPPAALRARIDAAIHEAEADARRMDELRRDHDFSVGQRTRTFLILVLGTLWSCVPLLGQWTGVAQSLRGLLAGTLAILLVCGALGLWARDSLSKSAINRRLAASVLVVFVAQACLLGAASIAGWSVFDTRLAMIFMWAVVLAMVVITIDSRLIGATVGYVAGFYACAAWPEHAAWFMAGSNLILTVNAVAVWRPGSRHPPGGGL